VSQVQPRLVQVTDEDLSSIVEHSPIAMCVATPIEGILKLNRAVCELTGHTEGSLLGRRLIHTLVHPEDVDEVAWVGQEVMGGRAVEVRHRLLTASREVRWVRGSISPMLAADGSVRWAIAQYIDETELVESTAALERSRAALRSFAEVVAHDLRTPIGAIGGFAELLIEHAQDRLTALDIEMLESIQRSVDRAVQLIEASLAHAKEEGSTSTRAFPLSWILARVRDLLDPQLRACEGTIELVRDAVIDTDERAVFETILNLAQNALKYRSGRPPKIVVDADLHAGRITITDNGRGIPGELWSTVFERAVKVQPGDDGLGLGLARCRSLVESLGGRLLITASGDWGTRMVVELSREVFSDEPVSSPT
jgi:PAS domain S-box-containing protein